MDMNVVLPVAFLILSVMELLTIHLLFKPALLKKSKDGILTKEHRMVIYTMYAFIVMILAFAAFIYQTKFFG